MDYTVSSAVSKFGGTIKAKEIVICGCNTFGWDQDKVRNIISGIYQEFNKDKVIFGSIYNDKLADAIEKNVDIFCIQEAGKFNEISFFKSFERHHCEWIRKDKSKILKKIRNHYDQYYDENLQYMEFTKEYFMSSNMERWNKESYDELLEYWYGSINMKKNSRCSIGIICKKRDSADGLERIIDITGSYFHRPVFGLAYYGLPVYSVHAPASNKDMKKAQYIYSLITKMIDMHGSKWIAVGDFNFDPLLSNKLLEEKYKNGNPLSDYASICAPNEATQDKGGTLDYAIYGKDINCGLIKVLPSTYTDHRPVLYKVAFSP